jgi:type II secretory pathway component GspD/PulD (secretin)
MPFARSTRSLELFAALAAVLPALCLGSLHATFAARAKLPAARQPQSDSAKPAQTQQSPPANAPDTTNKPTPPASTNSSSTPSTPPVKADLKKAKQANKQGLRAEEQGDWQAAYEAYEDAVNFAPNDTDYFSHREIAKSHVVQMKVDLAERHAISGEIPAALHALREARELDPANKVIRDRLTELAALDPTQAKQVLSGPEPPREVHLEHSPGKQNFQLRGDTQAAYEEIARKFGVDVAFDVDLRSRQVRIDANDLDFATVMRILGEQTHTFWRPLTKHLFFVADDTTQKRKDYDVSIVRTILFSATETPEQMTEISHLVRDIAGITRIQLDTRSRTLTMRASPQAIAVASGVMDDLDQPVGELVLEIEILEVDRNYAEQLGILPPQTSTVFPIPSNAVTEAESGLTGLIAVITQIFGGSTLGGLSPSQLGGLLGSGQVNVGSLIPPIVAFGGGASTFLATLPGAAASFSEMLSLVRTGRRILLRAQDNQPATFFVGERFPVSLAQYSASLGTSGASGVSIPGVGTGTLPITTLATGNAPDFVTTADVNADGFQDLIVANFTDNTLSIYLGNGDGTFQNPVTPAPTTGAGPISIATGTFNSKNNTNVGLAVANQTDNTLSILLGNGDGTFTAATGSPIKTGNHPVSVVTATLVTGGLLDLIVANQQDNTVSIFMGNGDGTFAAPVNLATGHAPTGLVVADFNNDGNLDLAVTNQTDNSVSVYLGKGDGTFNTPISYPTGQAPVYVASADFNGDNILDLAVANNGAGTSTLSGASVSILLGVGNGTFGATTNFPAGNGPTSIAIADFTVDGFQDLAVTAQTDNAVALLLGLGDGSFSSPVEIPVETNPVSLATAVFTDSGQPDLAVANNGSNTVSVILNSAEFSSATGNTASTGTQFPNAEYIDVGVKVKATPRIHQNDEVTLQLEFTISSLTGTILNNIPVVANEEVHQTVRVKTNQTAALAGFRSPQYTRGLNGTPGLGEVPGAGLLAASEDVQKQNTEVLILMTPRIVALAPRKDHLIYAGRGALEGAGSQGPTHQERQERPRGAAQPEVPPQAQPQPGAQPQPAPEPGAQPQQPSPQAQPAPQQQPEPQPQ